MYCAYEPFVLTHVVYGIIIDDKNNITHQGILYQTNNMDDLCHFMAIEYQNAKYEKIVLHGLGADKIADDIREYSLTHYNNNNINIEVVS